MTKATKRSAKKSVTATCRTRRKSTPMAEPESLPPVELPRKELRRAPRPSGCPRFVRREIAEALPSICAMLLSRTMEGDLSALKLLLQMALETGEKERSGVKRSTGFARKVLAGFKEWEARERAGAQGSGIC